MLEKQVMLQVLDVHWKEHLAEIDHLRQSIGLRAYAQKNPKNEYKREAYAMFEDMLDQINKETIRVMFTLQINSQEEISNIENNDTNINNDELELKKEDFSLNTSEASNNQELLVGPETKTIKREEPKFGRNEVVKITNGIDTKEIKYKKAKPLIETGEWKLL
jgi:preprotein translocase subunit SecA